MDKTYDVGYRKPLKNSQFKKGVSGNPMGRPRKVPSDVADILLREMKQIVQTKDGQKMTKNDAMFKNLANSAAKGDLKSIRIVLQETHRAESKCFAQMFWDRLLADGFIEPDAARDYANKRGKLKLNMGVLKQEQINRISAIGALNVLEAIACFSAMEEVTSRVERIMFAIFAEYQFWDDIEAGWDVLNLSDEQRELVKQETIQLRAYERPTLEMVQKAVDLFTSMRRQCDMWYAAYREVYADTQMLSTIVYERHVSQNHGGMFDKSGGKFFQEFTSICEQAYGYFMSREFPFADMELKCDLTMEDVDELYKWYMAGYKCMHEW